MGAGHAPPRETRPPLDRIHPSHTLIAIVAVALATVLAGVALTLAGKEAALPTLFTVTGPVLAALIGWKQALLAHALRGVERNTNGTLAEVRAELTLTREALRAALARLPPRLGLHDPDGPDRPDPEKAA